MVTLRMSRPQPTHSQSSCAPCAIHARNYANGRLFWAMMTSSNETFPALLAICVGNSPVTGEFPAQRPMTRSSDVFFDLRLNKQLRKQWWSWWFDTPSIPLWRHCNAPIQRFGFGRFYSYFSGLLHLPVANIRLPKPQRCNREGCAEWVTLNRQDLTISTINLT